MNGTCRSLPSTSGGVREGLPRPISAPTSRSRRPLPAHRRPQERHPIIPHRPHHPEWAYATAYLSDDARAATYAAWLHSYNHHRPHTGIGGQVPADRIHNDTGNYT